MKSDREGIENKLWKIRELEGGKPITLVLYNRFDKVTSDHPQAFHSPLQMTIVGITAPYQI